MSEEYNGWPNRETWALGLHLDNDHGLHLERQALVAAAVVDHAAWADEHGHMAVPSAAGFVGRAVQEWVEGMFERVFYPAEGEVVSEVVRLMAADVGSLWRVEWWCLAEHWVAEHREAQEVSA